MMTHNEAVDFQSRLTADMLTLKRARKAELEAAYAAELERVGIIFNHRPATKDSLMNDILNRRYPLAQVNEASHVLYHRDVIWPACDHCPKPEDRCRQTDACLCADCCELKYGNTL